MARFTKEEAKAMAKDMYAYIDRATGITPKKHFTEAEIKKRIDAKIYVRNQYVKTITTVFINKKGKFELNLDIDFNHDGCPIVFPGVDIQKLIVKLPNNKFSIMPRGKFEVLLWQEINAKIGKKAPAPGTNKWIYIIGLDVHNIKEVKLLATEDGLVDFMVDEEIMSRSEAKNVGTKGLLEYLDNEYYWSVLKRVKLAVNPAVTYTEDAETYMELYQFYAEHNNEKLRYVLYAYEYEDFVKDSGHAHQLNLNENSTGYVVCIGLRHKHLTETEMENKYLAKAANVKLLEKIKKVYCMPD